MVGSDPPVITDLTVPLPRRPLEAGSRIRDWYENELEWPTVPARRGTPLRLSVGERFDVLDVPAEVGRAGLRHLAPYSPVALQGERMRLLVAPGSAEELPGLLDWLEWGGLVPDLRAIGEGGVMDAPSPPDRGDTLQGAAVWLRPPEPGRTVEASLPTLSAAGDVGGAPDLVRLVGTVAAHCHRLWLRRVCAQPSAIAATSDQALAFS
ncbi:SCO3374 family protein [Streptomyces sp. NPDC058954]|uniref:SCO3374 family protein n=1 Tax=Streptomyces sp. NPDC058954 TaxID=3346677 RepID=UPI00368CFA0D